MLTNQGTGIHFHHPKAYTSLAANPFTILGHAEKKQLPETQCLKPTWCSVTRLRRLAEALPTPSVDGKAPRAAREDDDDDVPDLVENFDEASKNGAN